MERNMGRKTDMECAMHQENCLSPEEVQSSAAAGPTLTAMSMGSEPKWNRTKTQADVE